MKALQSPSNAFVLPAPRVTIKTCAAHFKEITAIDMKLWKEARKARLLERQRYWESCRAK